MQTDCLQEDLQTSRPMQFRHIKQMRKTEFPKRKWN